MTIRLAPVLHELAGRLAGRPAGDFRAQPVEWAYALRDAAALARPDVLISHWDAALEADALASADDLYDAPPLADTPPTSSAIELVSTLTELFRGSSTTIAASLTGPVTTAATLCKKGDGPLSCTDPSELADVCADALAALVGAYGAAGASLILVIEPATDFLDTDDVAAAQAPLVRALSHQRLDSLLVAPAVTDVPAGDYAATAVPWDGVAAPPAVALLDPQLWALPPADFTARWPALLAAATTPDHDVLLLSDGPLPAGIPLENLQAARAHV